MFCRPFASHRTQLHHWTWRRYMDHLHSFLWVIVLELLLSLLAYELNVSIWLASWTLIFIVIKQKDAWFVSIYVAVSMSALQRLSFDCFVTQSFYKDCSCAPSISPCCHCPSSYIHPISQKAVTAVTGSRMLKVQGNEEAYPETGILLLSQNLLLPVQHVLFWLWSTSHTFKHVVCWYMFIIIIIIIVIVGKNLHIGFMG